MKEKELIKLGFERIDVPVEESGDEPYYFYVLDIGDISLMSSTNDEIDNEEDWKVNLFDYELYTKDYRLVRKLIYTFKQMRHEES